MNALVLPRQGLQIAQPTVERAITYDYVNALGTPDQHYAYEAAVGRLGTLGTRALTTLAEVHLDYARNSPKHTESSLDAAEDVLYDRVYSETMGFDPRAAIRLAQLPLYRAVLGNPHFPTHQEVADAHQLTLFTAATALNHHIGDVTGANYDDNQMAGTLAEAAVLLLATRFCLKNNLTSDWLPVWSFLSEDVGRSNGFSAWDMNVYIPNHKGRPTLGYKVQVKSGHRTSRTYARDIAVIRINPDLATKGEGHVKSSRIIAECHRDMAQQRAPKRIVKALAERTDKFLTTLDKAV